MAIMRVVRPVSPIRGHDSRIMLSDRPADGLPVSFARCRYDCGRLVWWFDSGCCALCDTAPRPGLRAGPRGRR